MSWNSFMSDAAFLLGASQIIFIINFCYSIFFGEKTSRNQPKNPRNRDPEDE
jgi:heme/copper-type cytochrome/quinol oxidase subunit 1